MKIIGFFVALLAPFVSFCQWQDDTTNLIYTAKPDSIFWVEDIHKYAEENNFLFINDNGDFVEGENYYFIGQWFSSFMGGGYYCSNVHTAIKDGELFRTGTLPATIPYFTTITPWDTIINNHRCVVFITQLNNIHNGYSIVMTYGEYWVESLNIIDIENNELLFSYPLAEQSNFFYQWDLDMYYRSDDENALTEEELDTIYSFNNSQDQYFINPKTLDTIDRKEYRDTPWSVVYDYNFNTNKIEFYRLNIKAEDRDNPETYSEAISDRKKLKPEFYYQYYPSEKKWVKKIPTH